MTEKNNLKEIGHLIEALRERSDMTQSELAEKLGTSQSAVARMEKGEQNFTTEILTKVSDALHHNILTLSKGTINFQIKAAGNFPARSIPKHQKMRLSHYFVHHSSTAIQPFSKTCLALRKSAA